MVAPMNEALLPTIPTAETPSEPIIDSAKTVRGFSRKFHSLVAGMLLMMPAMGVSEAGDPAAASNESTTHGTLVIAGGGILPPDIRNHFIDLAGGRNARIVVIPTASEDAGDPEKEATFRWEGLLERVDSFDVFHARDREIADHEQSTEVLDRATGVWFTGGVQSRLTAAYHRTRTLEKIQNVLKRGGVVGGTSAGAAVMTKVMIERGNPVAEVGDGLGFFEGDFIVDQHFRKRNRENRMRHALGLHPGHVGIGIDEGTALIVKTNWKDMRVIGTDAVHIFSAPSKGQTHTVQLFKEGDTVVIPAIHGTPVTMAP